MAWKANRSRKARDTSGGQIDSQGYLEPKLSGDAGRPSVHCSLFDPTPWFGWGDNVALVAWSALAPALFRRKESLVLQVRRDPSSSRRWRDSSG